MIHTVIDATGPKGVRNVISNRCFITGFMSITGQGLVPFEGPLERDFLEVMEFHRKCSYIGAQPLKIFHSKDRRKHYTPDYLCKFHPVGSRPPLSPILFEVKTRADLKKNREILLPGFMAARELCRERGWRFRIATEKWIRTPAFSNIQFLTGFIDVFDLTGSTYDLLGAMKKLKVTTPDALLTHVSSVVDRLIALPVLWHLVVTKKIGFDMSIPLTMQSKIWAV